MITKIVQRAQYLKDDFAHSSTTHAIPAKFVTCHDGIAPVVFTSENPTSKPHADTINGALDGVLGGAK